MANLLQDTIEFMGENGLRADKVVFIGSKESGHSCSWSQFQVLADIEYDDGFGSQDIADDLIIAFSDSYIMRRWEYDGSEGWELLVPFKVPEVKLEITTLCDGSMWKSLAEMNSPKRPADTEGDEDDE